MRILTFINFYSDAVSYAYMCLPNFLISSLQFAKNYY